MSGTQPDISLQVAGGGGRGAPALPGTGVLGQIGSLATVQNQMNTLRLFQQEFAAKTAAGQIIAGAPDLETGIKGILGNPQTAAFAPGIVNELRQMQLTMTQIQGTQAGQARDAFGAVMKAATGAITDPTRLPGLIQSQLQLMPPEIRQRVAPAVQTYTQSLLSDLPPDPGAARTEYQKRLIGTLMGAGVSSDAVSQTLGTATTQQIGNRLVSGVQQPATSGGGFTGASSLPIGSPAGWQNVGGVPTPAPGVPGDTPGPAATGNQLGGGSPPVANELAADGKPLFNPGAMVSPAAGRGAGLAGINVLSPVQQDQAKTLQTEYSTTGLKKFESAQESLASMQYMDSAFDNMVKNGGFLIPGTAANFRTDLAKGVNTIAQVFGAEPPFDPTKITSAEDFNKETKRMGLMVTNQFLGGQREASQIIQGITSSVPAIENSYMGGKLILGGIQAAVQRVIDQRKFENAWQADPRNQGSLVGAAEAFNAAHPARDYADQVLGRFGMSENGFRTPEAVGGAVKSGFLTPAQGAAALHQLFPERFHPPGGAPATPGQ
jgi:hypothetical protein